MTDLPSYTPQKLPEGEYIFTVSKEPEKRKRHNKKGEEFIAIDFFFKIDDGSGSARQHRESMVPWEERYGDLLLALGGKPDSKGQVHFSDMPDPVGKKFTAEILHEPDKEDATKSWARLANIVVPEVEAEEAPIDEDVPLPDDSEVPF